MRRNTEEAVSDGTPKDYYETLDSKDYDDSLFLAALLIGVGMGAVVGFSLCGIAYGVWF